MNQSAATSATLTGNEDLAESIIKFFSAEELNHQDDIGCVALHYAVQQNSTRMVDVLLEYGASDDIPDIMGLTPFELAKEMKNLEALVPLWQLIHRFSTGSAHEVQKES